jgi:hypothetical protein
MTDRERIAALEAQVANLRSALEPFVLVAESFVSHNRLDRGCVWRSALDFRPYREVTVGQYERALALLDDPPRAAA